MTITEKPMIMKGFEDEPGAKLCNIGPMVQMARDAQEEWASWPLEKRKVVLIRSRDLLLERWESFADLISKETGKLSLEAVGTDVLTSLVAADHSIRSLRKLFAPRRVRFESMGPMMWYMGRLSYIQNRPLGVIGVISPWNYPLAIPYSQTVMALAAGNAVIIKPSPETPLTAMAMQRLFDESGLPGRLVQTFLGGDDHGRELVTSGVDRIVFTGSSEAGKQVMALASQRLTPVTLELGGKDPCIILEDADLERAADGVAWGAFVNAGQTCTCVKRVYVHEMVRDRFLELLKNRVSALRLGVGDDADVGPLFNEAALRSAEEMVSVAVMDGGTVLVGGRRPEGVQGTFYEPTVVVDVPQSSRAVQEEVFGPILTVNRFTSDEEAIGLANCSPYALSGSVWSRDIKRARSIAERLRGGTVVVNNVSYTYGLPMTPWGGQGMTGFGRTHGAEGFAELMEPHHVHIDKGRFPKEVWWHPYRMENMAEGHGLLDLLYGRGIATRMRAMLKLRKALKGR
jgi:succinate-semialdehyde dehydrogenase/glutarate-semialdehyde dehydrogenase